MAPHENTQIYLFTFSMVETRSQSLTNSAPGLNTRLMQSIDFFYRAMLKVFNADPNVTDLLQ